jgi:hypothetical protein
MSNTRIPLITLAALLTACEPSPEQKAQWAEARRVECLDKICEGDVLPPHDVKTETVFKIGGQWFVVPRVYGGYGGSLAFLWPSKTPANSPTASQTAPEFVPSGPGQTSNFYDVAVEIFLRSDVRAPSGPSGYQRLQQDEAEGRLISKQIIRPGLELWRIRRESGTTSGLLYVATELKGSHGNPPVLGCDDGTHQFDRCTTGFQWQPGISVDIRFHAKHATDWPEIHLEVVRVLHQLRRG